MTTQQDEHFSALMDGELDGANSETMLNRLKDDPQARERWSRYHLISDTLRAKLPEHIDLRFSASIMAAIEAEPVVLAPHKPAHGNTQTPTFRHRAAGFAIAATVAVVAVVGVRNLNEPAQPEQVAQMPSSSEFVRLPEQPQVAQAQVPAQVVPQQMFPGAPSMTVSSTQSTPLGPAGSAQSQAEFDARLHQYIVSHNQYISGGQFQTMMPYVRIVVSPTIVHDQGQQ